MNKSAFDNPEITSILFHPRKDLTLYKKSANIDEILIPVEDEVAVGGRLFKSDVTDPVILFFHGNGEIVNDYNDLAELFQGLGINFLTVDYRGYGRSSGKPTATSMLEDSHKIYKFIRNKLSNDSFSGPFVIMGRSLGSAAAIELASKYNDEIDSLIIESGFANTIPLIKHLGVNVSVLKITEDTLINNIEKIKKLTKPVLIIHAEFDHIIPFSEGVELYNAVNSTSKKLMKISGANHNNIFQLELKKYIEEILHFITKIKY